MIDDRIVKSIDILFRTGAILPGTSHPITSHHIIITGCARLIL